MEWVWPDSRDKSREFSEKLYDTLHHKLMTLPDNIMIFPAHIDKYIKAGEDYGHLSSAEKESASFQLQKNDFVRKDRFRNYGDTSKLQTNHFN